MTDAIKAFKGQRKQVKGISRDVVHT